MAQRKSCTSSLFGAPKPVRLVLKSTHGSSLSILRPTRVLPQRPVALLFSSAIVLASLALACTGGLVVPTGGSDAGDSGLGDEGSTLLGADILRASSHGIVRYADRRRDRRGRTLRDRGRRATATRIRWAVRVAAGEAFTISELDEIKRAVANAEKLSGLESWSSSACRERTRARTRNGCTALSTTLPIRCWYCVTPDSTRWRSSPAARRVVRWTTWSVGSRQLDAELLRGRRHRRRPGDGGPAVGRRGAAPAYLALRAHQLGRLQGANQPKASWQRRARRARRAAP